MKKLPFLKSFIFKMDEKLQPHYDNITTREDFVKFFFWFDAMSYLNKDGDYISFFNNKERLKKDFGRKKVNGKQIFKLDDLIKKSILSGIIGQTGYSNFAGNKYTRKYFYMLDFIDEVMDSEIEIIIENVDYKDYDEFHNIVIPTDPGLKSQYDLLTSNRFQVDFSKGCELLINLYNDKVEKGILTKEESVKRLKIQVTRLIHLSDKIIFVKSDSNTGRVFTSFCTIKREIRGLCTIDGLPLREVDLKSSQPFLWLSILLKENPANEQVKKLYDILLHKDIYLHFMDLFVWENGSHEYIEWDGTKKTIPDRSNLIDYRNAAKLEFMRFLFKDARGGVPFQNICKMYFPDVFKLTQELKKRSGNLSVLLQKTEADIFIPIQNELVSEGSLSVHDSLYVKSEIEVKAKQKLTNQIKLVLS